MELGSDFVGSTSGRETDKWSETRFTPLPAERLLQQVRHWRAALSGR
jgi:hypothetical protein